MSTWRRQASERLPELQSLIVSRDIDNPMMLWIELHLVFEKLCEQKPLPFDMIKRIWDYAKWCMKSPNDDVGTAAAYAFCEHLLDTKATQAVLPSLMTRKEFEGLKALLVYQNSEDEYQEALKLFRKPNRK